ncbi:hypothetical protein GMDG_04506 [Pseudogymnoascus destructans 20631-21]|uniref:Alpha/beta hydrolase fold-3 domain-containing protein n=1 Tax=Pseudogymnoascus destructans (strain ATCC MYA-4855 / 20631-21) TaxID=658429 RepID=L8GDE9_PSED2|nr:hypothetical protein GMDG_04506 [Pseudogymnoascus destructans 20631-21]
MPFNTATVGTAVTPTVIATLISHYLNRKKRKTRALKPTAHISYDEGLALIRQFLLYASHHTVEELQGFTSQKIAQAATTIQTQLGPEGIEQVGGKTWWQWRRPGSELKAEWIEMRADYLARKKSADKGRRVIYQLQRHARKLNARVFAPRYRLAPQFPFPAPLQDCLAAYLYLLESGQDASTIVMAGDSAGGGMVLSLLCMLRDQGLPLPAGAVLISPWVDLTQSFPSVAGDSTFDYVPPHGFHQRPSPSWPPPNSDDIDAIMEALATQQAEKMKHVQENDRASVVGYHVQESSMGNQDPATARLTSVPGKGPNISVAVDGKIVEVIDQIHMSQFSAWELARAQKREIESLDDDAVSVISRSTSEDGVSPIENELAKGAVGKAGDPLPPFHHHMIQHRVDRHGNIFELAHASELPGCTMPREEIGSVKPGPARRWMAAKAKFDQRFAREKRKMQRRRIREMGEGYEVFVGETPPPSALAGRRVKGKEAAERKRKTGWGLGMWSLWGSEHDKQTIQRELNATNVDTAAASPDDGAGAATRGDALGKSSLPVITDAIHLEEREHSRSRSNSRRVSVMDRNQTGERDDVDEDTPAADLVAMQQGPNERAVVNQYLTPEFAARRGAADGAGRGERDGKPVRPKAGGKAFPFSARGAEGERPESAASMATLISEMGVRPVGEVEQ